MTSKEQAGKIIEGLVGKIRDHYHPEKIILFGSHADGRADRDSDIDFLIIKATEDRPIDREIEVVRIISDPERMVPVEPIVLTPTELQQRLEAGDQFIEDILRRGKVLYAA